MTTIITFGVYDCLHYGHINLFSNCKKIGDFLIVAVQDDAHVKVNKPGCDLCDNEETRLKTVESVKFVDKALLYSQIDETIANVHFDILAVGPDQTNDHFKRAIDYCKKNGKEVVVIPRTPDISSTIIRNSK